MNLTKNFVKRLTVKQWSGLMTISALGLWSLGLLQTTLKLDGYGLIHSYPVSFFVALGMLTIAAAILWGSRQNHGKLLFLQLFFLIASLWLTPLIIGGIGNSGPTFAASFAEYGNADYIIRQGHFVPDIFWRFNWPGVYIITAAVVQVLKVSNPDIMLAILPFLWQFIILVPLYLIFKNTLNEEQSNYRWAALWVLYAGSWSEVAVLHTQTLSNLLLLTLLAILTARLGQKVWGWSVGSALGSIILAACLTITHLMTSIVSLAMVTAMSITKKLSNYIFVLISFIFIAAWLLYGATSFFEGQLPAFLDKVLRLDILFSSSVTARMVGNVAHQTVVQVRLLFTALFGIIGIAGFILGRRNKTGADGIMVAMGVGAVGIAIIIGAGYGWETPQRFFFFLMLPIAYFAVKLLQRRATAAILVILLIASLPFYFVSRYGNQAADYSSPPTMTSWHFFEDHTTHGVVVSDGPFGSTRNIEQYKIIYFPSLIDSPEPLAKLPDEYPQYICISNQDQALFNNNYGKTEFIPDIQNSLDGKTSYNVIYVNPDVKIYIKETKMYTP